jgi:hypothetical protein
MAARSVIFWDVPMRSLLRSHVEAWVKAMQIAHRGTGKPRGLAPGTIRTRFNNVRAVLRGAVKDRIIAADPSDGVRLPRTRRADVAMELPTPEQVRRFLDAADPRFRTFVALCAFAGSGSGKLPRYRPATSTSGHGENGNPAAPEHRRLLVAQDARFGRPPDGQAARPPALLRLGTDRGRLRRRHRPTGARPLQRDRHAQHLRAPVAHRGGPHPGRRRRNARRRPRQRGPVTR